MGVRLRSRGQRESAEWHTKISPRPKKARMSRCRAKTMIIVFFDSRGIVHKEFAPPGRTVNHAFYKDVGTTSKTGPASPKGHCRQLGAAPR